MCPWGCAACTAGELWMSLCSLWWGNHFFFATCRDPHSTWLVRNPGASILSCRGLSGTHSSPGYSPNTSDCLAKSKSETNDGFSHLCSYQITFTWDSSFDLYSSLEGRLAQYSKQFSVDEYKDYILMKSGQLFLWWLFYFVTCLNSSSTTQWHN